MKNDELEIQNRDEKNLAGNMNNRPNEKHLHIVFQVMNFLFGEEGRKHNILAIDKLLLIALAKHHGRLGICPSVGTLAKALHVSIRYISMCLVRLECANLIQVVRKPGHRSQYIFKFLSADPRTTVQGLSEISLTNPGTTVQGSTDKLSTDHRTTVQGFIHKNAVQNLTTPEPQFLDPRTTVQVISFKDQLRSRTEREDAPKNGASLSSLSLSKFEPSEENKLLASSSGVNLDEELESFKERHEGKATQYEFKRWLKNAAKYQQSKPKAQGAGKEHQQVASTVPKWEPGHPSWEAVNGRIPNVPPVYDLKSKRPDPPLSVLPVKERMRLAREGKLEEFLNEYAKSGNTGR